MTRLYAMCVLLFCGVASLACAQGVTEQAEFVTHGGYAFVMNIGANQGDTITVEVDCELQHNERECFQDLPRLQPAYQDGFLCLLACANFTPFEKTLDLPRHQVYVLNAYEKGDNFVIAPYSEMGWDTLFHIRVKALEP